MESKDIFICRKTKEVQMLRGFMAALEIIKRDSAKWDGKVLNKRYTDAMTAAVADVATCKRCGVQHQSVEVRFETTYFNERTGRIELVWNDRFTREKIPGFFRVRSGVVDVPRRYDRGRGTGAGGTGAGERQYFTRVAEIAKKTLQKHV